MSSKAGILDSNSKSLPPNEFPIISISSADSGIDSDASPNSTNSIEDIEAEDVISPHSLLLGKDADEKDRIEGINKAIGWVKDELVKMKIKDKQLTKAMIIIRSKIAAQKLHLEKHDTWHDPDSENRKQKNDQYLKERWKLIAKDGAFPTDGESFDNNKRATWAI